MPGGVIGKAQRQGDRAHLHGAEAGVGDHGCRLLGGQALAEGDDVAPLAQRLELFGQLGNVVRIQNHGFGLSWQTGLCCSCRRVCTSG